MPVDMYLYLPLDGSAGENMTIVDHATEIAAIFSKPVEKKEEEEEDDNNYNWRRGRRGGGGDLPADLAKFHEAKGFCSILAWSHGCSSSASVFQTGRGNMQDISMTKYNDKLSPLAYVAVMRGELLPRAVLRVHYPAKEGKFDIIEYVLEQVQISSISTGGSGGEDRLTENLTLTFGAMSVRIATIDSASGDIVSDSRGSWNLDTNSGTRDGASMIPPLALYCKRFFNENRSLFERKDLIQVVKKKLAEANEVGIDKSALTLPPRGLRVLFAQETRKERFREGFLHKLDLATIRQVAVTVFGLKPESLDSLFVSEGSRLVEVVKDAQVESLDEGSSIVFSVKA